MVVPKVSIKEFSNYDGIRANIMPEHRELMLSLVNLWWKLIPNIGSRLAERTDNVIYINNE
jgi:hypothetical protein